MSPRGTKRDEALETSQALNRFYVKLISDIKVIANRPANTMGGRASQMAQINHFCGREFNEKG